MAKVKYLSKVWLPKNAIFVEDTFDHGGEQLVTTSLDKMFEEIKKYYSFGNGKRNKISNYIRIGIYNLDADNIAPKQYSMTYRESKDILCKYAYYRALYLSPNLTEVYCEFFHLDLDGANGAGFEYRYDYGILYGNYPYINSGTIVKSSYIPNEELSIYPSCWNCIDKLDEKCSLFDVHMYYDAYYKGIDSNSKYPDRFEDGCVPVSTMKIVKEGN